MGQAESQGLPGSEFPSSGNGIPATLKFGDNLSTVVCKGENGEISCRESGKKIPGASRYNCEKVSESDGYRYLCTGEENGVQFSYRPGNPGKAKLIYPPTAPRLYMRQNGVLSWDAEIPFGGVRYSLIRTDHGHSIYDVKPEKSGRIEYKDPNYDSDSRYSYYLWARGPIMDAKSNTVSSGRDTLPVRGTGNSLPVSFSRNTGHSFQQGPPSGDCSSKSPGYQPISAQTFTYSLPNNTVSIAWVGGEGPFYVLKTDASGKQTILNAAATASPVLDPNPGIPGTVWTYTVQDGCSSIFSKFTIPTSPPPASNGQLKITGIQYTPGTNPTVTVNWTPSNIAPITVSKTNVATNQTVTLPSSSGTQLVDDVTGLSGTTWIYQISGTSAGTVLFATQSVGIPGEVPNKMSGTALFLIILAAVFVVLIIIFVVYALVAGGGKKKKEPEIVTYVVE